jgi:hypothetical protein
MKTTSELQKLGMSWGNGIDWSLELLECRMTRIIPHSNYSSFF